LWVDKNRVLKLRGSEGEGGCGGCKTWNLSCKRQHWTLNCWFYLL